MEPIKTEIGELQYQEEKYWHSKRVLSTLWYRWISEAEGAVEVESAEIEWNSKANHWRNEYDKSSKAEGLVARSYTLITNANSKDWR